MKRIIYFSLISLLLTFSACVESTYEDIYVQDDFYKTEVQAKSAILGAYSTLAYFNYYRNNLMYGLIGYEDCLFNTGTTQVGLAGRNQHGSTTVMFSTPWGLIYSGINQCNEIIKLVPEIKFTAGNEKEKERIIAEAYFLRAFYYYDLIRYYGVGEKGVPVHTEPVNVLADAYAPVKSTTEVYELIISDLEYAAGIDTTGIDRLPLYKNSKGDIGRATKGAAEALLANVHLTLGHWDEAIQYANNVISSNQYELLPFNQLWNVQDEQTAYREVIFGIQFINNPNNINMGSVFAYAFGPAGVNIDGSALTGNVNGKGSGNTRVQNWFVRFFQDDADNLGFSDRTKDGGITNLIFKDYRIESSFFRSYNNGTKTALKDEVLCYPVPGSATTQKHVFIKKYIDPQGLENRCHANDLFLFRYAEMYLILAEAYNELNDYENACKSIDKIRERARKTDGSTIRQWPKDFSSSSPYYLGRDLTQDEFRWAVFMERGLEFTGEFKRFFDLQRMRYKGKEIYDYMKDDFLPAVPAANIDRNNCILSDRKKYFPIPLEETSRNKYVTQNPGY